MIRTLSAVASISFTVFALAACGADGSCETTATCPVATTWSPTRAQPDASSDAGAEAPVHREPSMRDSSTPEIASPGVRVVAPTGMHYVVQGGRAELAIEVERLGAVGGDVVLRFDHLPPSVKIAPVIVPAGATTGNAIVEVEAARPQGAVEGIVIMPVVQTPDASVVPAVLSLYVRGVSGSVDTSFGLDGKVEGTVAAPFTHAVRTADGKILALSSEANCRVARFLPNGSLDPSFGDKGLAFTGVNGEGITPHLALDSAARIVVQAAQVVRLSKDGKPDPSWANGGAVSTAIGGGDAAGKFIAVALGPVDSVYAVDLCNEPGRCRSMRLVRLDSAGRLDTTFNAPTGSRPLHRDGVDGAFYSPLGMEQQHVAADGRFAFAYVAGNIDSYRPAVIRSAVDGTGEVRPTAPFDLGSTAPVIGPGPDGAIMFAFVADGYSRAVRIQRLSAALAVDVGFSGAVGWQGGVQSVATLPSGKVLATGHEDAKGFVIARFAASGAPDATFGPNGRITYPQAGSGVGSRIQDDGDVLVFGGTASSRIMHIWQ